MKITLLPKNKSGKLSFWSLISSVIFFALFFAILAIFDPDGGDTFFSTPSLFIPILLAFFTSFTAFASGVYSIIVRKERSATVFITSIIGLLVTIFGLSSTLFSL